MSGWGSVYSNTVYALATQSATLARLQEQVSSGLRVGKASDDPGSAVKIMDLRRKSASLDSYLKNLGQTSQTLSNSLNAMQAISTSLTRVRQLLTQASSGIYSDANRASMAEEVDTLLDQALSLANTYDLGQYSFGGQDVATAPYVVQRVNGRITDVRYAGSLEQMRVPVAPGTNIASQLVGDDIFRISKPDTPKLLGPTGAAAGSSPSTVQGDLWLTVADGGTTSYAPAGGLAAGSSAASDTIVGAHTITVDAAGSTVRLDGGPAVAFTADDDDLQLTNAAGQCVHVDMTGWVGADGQWQVWRSVTLSLDGGATTTTVTDFTQQAAVTDPRTGGVLMVDPSGISATGLDAVTVPGSYNLFGTLINIRDLMSNTNGLDSSRQQELLRQATTSLSTVTDNITQKLAAVGSRIQALDTMTQTLQTNRNAADDQAAMLQDADIVNVATELARSQNLYQMTLASAAKLLSLSLLDFIQ
jgi:flagellin-like hook-associated protein FlgL